MHTLSVPVHMEKSYSPARSFVRTNASGKSLAESLGISSLVHHAFPSSLHLFRLKCRSADFGGPDVSARFGVELGEQHASDPEARGVTMGNEAEGEDSAPWPSIEGSVSVQKHGLASRAWSALVSVLACGEHSQQSRSSSAYETVPQDSAPASPPPWYCWLWRSGQRPEETNAFPSPYCQVRVIPNLNVQDASSRDSIGTQREMQQAMAAALKPAGSQSMEGYTPAWMAAAAMRTAASELLADRIRSSKELAGSWAAFFEAEGGRQFSDWPAEGPRPSDATATTHSLTRACSSRTAGGHARGNPTFRASKSMVVGKESAAVCANRGDTARPNPILDIELTPEPTKRRAMVDIKSQVTGMSICTDTQTASPLQNIPEKNEQSDKTDAPITSTVMRLPSLRTSSEGRISLQSHALFKAECGTHIDLDIVSIDKHSQKNSLVEVSQREFASNATAPKTL
eukprot:GHVT01096952.1.p1 GENE.GHVT01096952.1~~GHVT01096952.1.p1  ORF type:complete len:456 (-),score=51.49 GHVT01096952.1:2544-3911(-)